MIDRVANRKSSWNVFVNDIVCLLVWLDLRSPTWSVVEILAWSYSVAAKLTTGPMGRNIRWAPILMCITKQWVFMNNVSRTYTSGSSALYCSLIYACCDVIDTYTQKTHGRGKLFSRHISASRWDRTKVLTAVFPIFDNGHSNGTNGNTARLNRKCRIQDGDL